MIRRATRPWWRRPRDEGQAARVSPGPVPTDDPDLGVLAATRRRVCRLHGPPARPRAGGYPCRSGSCCTTVDGGSRNRRRRAPESARHRQRLGADQPDQHVTAARQHGIASLAARREPGRPASARHIASPAFARTRNTTRSPLTSTPSTETPANRGSSTSTLCDMRAGHPRLSIPAPHKRHADQHKSRDHRRSLFLRRICRRCAVCGGRRSRCGASQRGTRRMVAARASAPLMWSMMFLA